MGKREREKSWYIHNCYKKKHITLRRTRALASIAPRSITVVSPRRPFIYDRASSRAVLQRRTLLRLLFFFLHSFSLLSARSAFQRSIASRGDTRSGVCYCRPLVASAPTTALRYGFQGRHSRFPHEYMGQRGRPRNGSDDDSLRKFTISRSISGGGPPSCDLSGLVRVEYIIRYGSPPPPPPREQSTGRDFIIVMI